MPKYSKVGKVKSAGTREASKRRLKRIKEAKAEGKHPTFVKRTPRNKPMSARYGKVKPPSGVVKEVAKEVATNLIPGGVAIKGGRLAAKVGQVAARYGGKAARTYLHGKAGKVAGKIAERSSRSARALNKPKADAARRAQRYNTRLKSDPSPRNPSMASTKARRAITDKALPSRDPFKRLGQQVKHARAKYASPRPPLGSKPADATKLLKKKVRPQKKKRLSPTKGYASSLSRKVTNRARKRMIDKMAKPPKAGQEARNISTEFRKRMAAKRKKWSSSDYKKPEKGKK